ARAQGTEGATATVPAHTMPGMVLGTAGHMSPEQVRGKEVDARTDIFAFGAILYEMLSGQRAFKGGSSIETMNAILKDDPPELETDKLQLSPGLERIVRRCLEKEPARRFHSARDVGYALEAISGSSSSSVVSRRALPPEGRRWIRAAVLALVAVAAVLGAYFLGKGNGSSSTASYQQLTFEPGYAGPARFTRDGNTVVYSASWNGGARQLYAQRTNSAQATPLNLDDVYEADITRDGKEFAVVRSEKGKQRLEFPIGKVLFETSGWMNDVRISPDGTQVAFIEHPLVPDDRGAVALVDRQGGIRRLTPLYATGRSLCWAPDGKEGWYAASLEGEDPGMYAVTLAAKTRTVLRSPTELVIEDISPAGRVLLESVRFQIEMGVKRSGDSRARDIETSVDLGSISPDGQWIVFNRYQGSDYKAYVKKADGVTAVKLGDGYGAGINWDASLVAAAQNSQLHKLYLYPTGAGEPRVVDLGELSAAFGTWENDLTFSRDGRWAVFSAFDPKQQIRDYLLDMRDGKLRPVTPVGTRAGKLSPDATQIVTLDIAADKYVLVDATSGKVSEIPGLEKDDEVLGWNLDGSMVNVWNQDLPARLSQVDVATGRRQFVQTIEPMAMLGSMYARMVTSADGKTVAYRHRRGLYAIYIADGLH